jgi:hypothetical protein
MTRKRVRAIASTEQLEHDLLAPIKSTRGKKMPYKDEDKAWGTDYTVDEIKSLMSSGAVPKDFMEILPSGAIQISAFVILTMKAFTKAELGEDWPHILGDYLHEAARVPNLNEKIKRALESILTEREEAESAKK